MGYYLRKSISVGPLRFNLSKSGIGVSAGIPGLRVGTGPRGNYIHVGRGGLYYRKTLSSPSADDDGRKSDHRFVEATPPETSHGPMEEIASGNVSQMVDSSSAALLAEIERKRKRMRLWPWIAAGGVMLLFFLVSAEVSQWLLYAVGVLLLVAVVGAFYWDMLKKSVVMMYELEDDSEFAFRNVYDAVSSLMRCGATWHISARGDVYDPKYHAGASGLVSRKSIHVGQHDPPYIRANLSIIRIPAGDRVLYFFPDQILLYSSQGVGALSYDDISVEACSTRFIEDGHLPRDAKVVDQTWKYVNKKGGPDRRFNDNHEIPICEYEQIQLTSCSGLNERLQASQLGIGHNLRSAFTAMGSALETCRKATVAAASSPLPEPQSPTSVRPASKPLPKPATKPKVVQHTVATSTPSMAEVYEALLHIMCCVMVVDGRASSTEKTRITELMKKVRAPWSAKEVDQQIARFISDVQEMGYKKVLSDSLAKVHWFGYIGRNDILFQCLESVTNADGHVSSQEKALCSKIRSLAS